MPPPPAPAPEPEALPHALTFFLSAGQRRRVLRALERHGADRATALVRALGVDGAGGAPGDEPRHEKAAGEGGEQ